MAQAAPATPMPKASMSSGANTPASTVASTTKYSGVRLLPNARSRVPMKL